MHIKGEWTINTCILASYYICTSKSLHGACSRNHMGGWKISTIFQCFFYPSSKVAFILSRFSVRNSIWPSRNFSELHCIAKATSRNFCTVIT